MTTERKLYLDLGRNNAMTDAEFTAAEAKADAPHIIGRLDFCIDSPSSAKYTLILRSTEEYNRHSEDGWQGRAIDFNPNSRLFTLDPVAPRLIQDALAERITKITEANPGLMVDYSRGLKRSAELYDAFHSLANICSVVGEESTARDLRNIPLLGTDTMTKLMPMLLNADYARIPEATKHDLLVQGSHLSYMMRQIMSEFRSAHLLKEHLDALRKRRTGQP
ncbi:hypothetical protein HYX14_01355 [Candidatus Woesearchaeota archaeon]|nr:hypothetical protein [Candidatus Woesearchaeota archaeon]